MEPDTYFPCLFPATVLGSLASHLPLFFLQLLLYDSFLEVNYIFIEDKCLRNLFQTFGGKECDFLTFFKIYKGDWSSVFILESLFSVAVGGFSNVTMRLVVMAFSFLPFYRYWTHLQILSKVCNQTVFSWNDRWSVKSYNCTTLEYLQVYSGYHQHWTALVTNYIQI